MPRAGIERVRTGCRSCKLRRVKCDEDRPACRRCRKSGLVCAGYATPRPEDRSWTQLLQVQPSIMGGSPKSNSDLQTLDFFRTIVAPALVGAVGADFWTRAVMQRAMDQAPARNAVLAISSIYRRLDPSLNSDVPTSADEDLSTLVHYNKALRQVATMDSLDAETALVLSILFTCVEFLRGNEPAAIAHCRHGIHIMKSAEGIKSSETVAIYRHLNIFPYFFGAMPNEFPDLGLALVRPISEFKDVHHAGESLDGLMSRSVRLIRTFDPYRLGVADGNQLLPPPDLVAEQTTLCGDLDVWYRQFSAMQDRQRETNDEVPSLNRILEMRWLVCKIWAGIASYRDETLCDSHRPLFERIVQLAREEAKRIGDAKHAARTPVFRFDMGLSPLLYFVAIKCRDLRLRLEALDLLNTLAYIKESIWDPCLLKAVARRIIEREHVLGRNVGSVSQLLETVPLDIPLPSDRDRIRDSFLGDDIRVVDSETGAATTQRRAYFYVRGLSDDDVATVPDWITLRQD